MKISPFGFKFRLVRYGHWVLIGCLLLAISVALVFLLDHRPAPLFQNKNLNAARFLGEDEEGMSQCFKLIQQSTAESQLALESDWEKPTPRLSWWIAQFDEAWLTNPALQAQRIKQLINQGGRVLLVPHPSLLASYASGHAATTARLEQFWAALGLNISLATFENDNESPAPEQEGSASQDFYLLSTTGKGPYFESIEEIATNWGAFWEGEDLLKSEIRLQSDGFPLVAEFNMGRGKLVLVSDGALFENEFLRLPHQNRELMQALIQTYRGDEGIALYAPEKSRDYLN